MWRKDVIAKYKSSFLEAKYAAYEDVSFSYKVGRTGKLVFAPECKLDFQEVQPDDVSNYEAFHSASYWRYYFVSSNPERSKLSLLWSQIGRNLDLTYRTSGGFLRKIQALVSASIIFFDLLYFVMRKTDPLKALELRLIRTD
jgi:hypothetical protein